MTRLSSSINIITRLLPVLALLWIAAGQTACKKQNSVIQHTDTLYPYIMDHLEANTDFSLLTTALTRCGLDTLLKDKGAYTLLAPTNNALQAAGLTQATISQMDKGQLLYQMKYLLLPGLLNRDTVQIFQYRPFYPLVELWNMDSLPLPLTYANNTFGIDSHPFNIADSLHAANGVVYRLSSFPQAPKGTISQVLSQMGLNYMLAAINHSDFSPIFSSQLDTLALMAPSDQAFINAGYIDTSSLIAKGTPYLDSLVQVHLMGRHISNYSLIGYYAGPAGITQAILFPAGVTRRWIIAGLAHNGRQFLTNQNAVDTYMFTFLFQNHSVFVSQTNDLGYLSDGTNYSFYRQRWNGDSTTVGNVITPNVPGINGLIHIIDHVLPTN